MILGRLRVRLPLLLAAAAIGGIGGFVGARLQAPVYRATATLLVVEPRTAGSGGAVDYNLTPIRSYTALLASPAISAPCRPLPGSGTSAAPRLRVRMPENTRLLELIVESGRGDEAAAFANCVAEHAADENRRINERAALANRELAVRAHDEAAKQVDALTRELADGRRKGHLELRHAEFRVALAEVEAAAAEERRFEMARVSALARKTSYETAERVRPPTRRLQSTLAADPTTEAVLDRAGEATGAGRSVAREEADPAHDSAGRGAVDAAAEEAGATAGVARARRLREAATKRAARLEEEIATLDGLLGAAGKRWEGAVSALSEIERRVAFSPLEAATKAFDLVPFAAAEAPAAPAGPRPALAGAAGAAAAFAAAALFVLSTPARHSNGTQSHASPGSRDSDGPRDARA